MSKLREKIEGEPVKMPTGFQYQRGSICRLSPDDDESVEEIRDLIDRSLCPRCEKPIPEDDKILSRLRDEGFEKYDCMTA